MNEEGRLVHNHTVDGWSREEEPLPVSEAQRKAWKGAIWSKRFAVWKDHEAVSACEGCGNEIDPDWCHCGDAIEGHRGMSHNHSPVPMRCQCGREPPEPDGECYRGGEAASALAEEQARIQRELK
jgi:hypothetical protein